MRRMRLWIARTLGLLVFCLTLGRVNIDWSGSQSHVRGADRPEVEAERSPGADRAADQSGQPVQSEPDA